MTGSSARPEQGRRDAALDVVVDWCGWLFAAVFVVGFVHGWWWGGDLHHLPLIGDTVAEAAGQHRGWPWIPLLSAILGAYGTRRAWHAMADWGRGIPRQRGARLSSRPVSGRR